jgi:hypothetical protein
MSGDGFLRHPLLAARELRHGFGTRAAAEPPGLWRPRQVHGAAVVVAEEWDPEQAPPADAILCERPGRPIGVVTADCVPLLAAAGRAVLAVHAGWRGLARGVVEAGLAALRRAAGGAPAVAVIGPHIGPCCYEIDALVLEGLARRFGSELEAALRPSGPGHRRLDLGRLVRHALERAGLAPERIGAVPGACTSCDALHYHSYRRDGARAGRLVHFVAAGRGGS